MKLSACLLVIVSMLALAGCGGDVQTSSDATAAATNAGSSDVEAAAVPIIWLGKSWHGADVKVNACGDSCPDGDGMVGRAKYDPYLTITTRQVSQGAPALFGIDLSGSKRADSTIQMIETPAGPALLDYEAVDCAGDSGGIHSQNNCTNYSETLKVLVEGQPGEYYIALVVLNTPIWADNEHVTLTDIAGDLKLKGYVSK